MDGSEDGRGGGGGLSRIPRREITEEGRVRGTWTSQEDAWLLELVHTYGVGSWVSGACLPACLLRTNERAFQRTAATAAATPS